MIWSYDDATGQIDVGREAKDHILSARGQAFDISGLEHLTASFTESQRQFEISEGDWKNEFLENIRHKYLIPDTNFVLRHYSSNVLARYLGSDFNRLTYRLPRLVVLEIERLANVKITEGFRKKSPSEAWEKEAKKRMAIYAIKEIKFLQTNTNYSLLPIVGDSLVSSFRHDSGEGFADAWIRKEILNFEAPEMIIGGTHLRGSLLLTCDLINAMAAEAEGLTSCYFIRRDQDNYAADPDNKTQLANLIVASAIIFGSVRLDVILTEGKVHESHTIRGIWEGKTPSQWYSDTVLLISN